MIRHFASGRSWAATNRETKVMIKNSGCSLGLSLSQKKRKKGSNPNHDLHIETK